jgi:trk system potassium uptake protein TrkH
MNLRAVGWLLGCVMLLLSGFLVVPAFVSFAFNELDSIRAFGLSSFLAALLGGALIWFNRGSTVNEEGRIDYFRREGLAVVGLTWLLVAAVGALPFLISGVIVSPVDAFFESASGFTTTGSTILLAEEIDQMPKGMAFWRMFTQWLGGIGIVMVFVVLFPTGGRSLFRSEVPGIKREAGRQRVRDSALALVRIYLGLTIVQVALLKAAGLDWFDAVTHSFTTLATGGFSTHSDSVAAFGSGAVELIIILFMFGAGLNFAIYDTVLRLGPRRGWRLAIASGEARAYVGMIVGSTAVISVALWFWGGSNGTIGSTLPDYRVFWQCVRDGLFSVVSLQTSTGFGTADFDRWPQFCRALLMFAALVGACAGSTGGGLKVVRFLIVAKAALRGIRRFARPRAIHSLRVDDQTLDERVVASVTGYFGLWMLITMFGTLCLSAFGFDLETSLTSVLATLNNIGPGLAMVGPTQSFATMPALAKLMLSLFMILGRLEFYAVVILLVPTFWRK